MTSQQTLIAETIRGMKLALKRRDNQSDSEDSIREHTNRGNKLKRKAHFVRDGRLDNTGGQAYKKRIDHAGYQRYIIHNNPPVYDADGDLLDPEEEYDEDFYYSAEDNPFDETKLEQLLMPLTSPTQLAEHPSLSVAYTSKHITEMAEDATRILHRERENLWQMKSYLEALRGDEMWAPLQNMETMKDPFLLDEENMGLSDGASLANTSMNNDTASAITNSHDIKAAVNGSKTNGEQLSQAVQADGIAIADMATTSNGTTSQPKAPPSPIASDGMYTDGANPDEDTPISHAMRTRAKARSPSEGSTSRRASTASSLSEPPSISAFFIPPSTSLPDNSLGLPEREAEETRRTLLLYVQKQEEVVRGTEQLLFGLLKADRMRAEVFKWCKAEGHVGELSDGEDWYDKDEWGLDGELVKGKEEQEEEDETKRRGRRREAKGRNAANGTGA